MLLYLFIYFVTIILLLKGKGSGNWQTEHMFFLFVMIFLALFVGFSDMLGGYDRYIYGELFDDVADITKKKYSYDEAYILDLYPKEIGYIYYNIILSYLTANRYIFILLVTFTIYILYYFSIKSYCVNYPFATMLFMGLIFFFTFTYLRQMLGVGIGWLALQYIYKRKPYRFLACVLLAASFHNSAIVLLPLYFVPMKRFKRNHIIWFMIFCLLLGLSGGPSALFRVYGEVADMHNRSDIYMEREIGFRYEYIIEAFVFLYIVLKNYTQISTTKKDTVMLNALLGFCAILLLFVQSLNGGRLGWYYLIGVIATLSTICNGIYADKQTKILVSLISLMLFVRIVFQWGVMLSPYKTFLTNGVRDNDPIYEKYEYDENYSQDKFYR